ncbi:MAG: hypothetical protein KME29_13585 [Calothrix sp. FI2-JRJ7]|jgi:cytoskeletal protein RodZ|nr:hypothetical protein [Calothrix sp. FI2-JRJ7]
MSKVTLALLSCVSFLSLTFWVSNAHAETLTQSATVVKQLQQYKVYRQQNAGAITPSVKTVTQPAVTEIVHVNPRAFSLDANSDTVGDVASARFGCDCFSCRAMALQMLQTGQLPLPQ